MRKQFPPKYDPDVPGSSLAIAQAVAHQPPPPVVGRRHLPREFPRDRDGVLDRKLENLEILESGRAALGTRRWAEITETVTEEGYSASALTVQVYAKTTGWERITGWLAVVPSGATGILQLGHLTIPLSAGQTNSPCGMNLDLATDDIRLLTVTQAGPVALALFGHVSPMTASLPI